MASQAIFAQGTLIKRETATPGTYETIAECKSISGPSLDTDDIDVTTHDGSEGFHEYIAGLKEGGELSFDINWNPTLSTHSVASGLLANYMEDGDKKKNWRVYMPEASVASGIYFAFRGYVKTFGVNAPVDDVLSASVSIKLAERPSLN